MGDLPAEFEPLLRALNESGALFVVVGLALAAFLVWAPQRFGSGTPWWLYAGAILGGMAVTAVAACWAPALRAARVDPAITLRGE